MNHCPFSFRLSFPQSALLFLPLFHLIFLDREIGGSRWGFRGSSGLLVGGDIRVQVVVAGGQRAHVRASVSFLQEEMMTRLFSRLWAWLRSLFEPDYQSPKRSQRETDGLPRQASSPADSTTLASAKPYAPELALETDEPPRYARSKSVLTFQERRFYLALLRAVENRHQVLAKVRLADFVYLANLPRDSKRHRNQLLCRHVDFLLCQPGTLAPLLAIELDDSSHAYPDNQARDEFKNELFNTVGLPLWRLKIQSGYSTKYVREQIDSRIRAADDSGDVPDAPATWAE